MHKHFFALLFLFLGFSVTAQFQIGISGGLNIGNWPGEDDIIISNANRLNLDEFIDNSTVEVLSVDNKSRFTGTIGLRTLYTFNDTWGLESGLYYSPQGDKIEGDATLTITDLNLTRPVEYEAVSITDYISLPLKAKYKLENGLAFNLGPQFAYRLNGEAITTGYFPETDDTLEFEEDISDRLKEFDFGVVGGLEYAKNHFGAAAEHFFATSQLPVEDRKVHNSVTSLKIFYTFN